MKCKVQVVIETETGDQVQQVACLERDSARLEEFGLTLAEAKSLGSGHSKGAGRGTSGALCGRSSNLLSLRQGIAA